MKTKIKNLSKLSKVIERIRKQKKRVVALSGAFDILHPGHIYFLEKARAFGDVLVVLLNSDSSIKSYKGDTRPINNEKNRAATLSALTAVSYIVIFKETTPIKLIEKIKPNVYCNGSDWGRNFPERAVVEKYGGKIKIISIKKGLSTSDIIKKVLSVYG